VNHQLLDSTLYLYLFRRCHVPKFGGHIGISDCRSLSQSLAVTFSTSPCSKHQICRWHLNSSVCYMFSDLTVSAVSRLISGCRPLMLWALYHFCRLRCGRKQLGFAVDNELLCGFLPFWPFVSLSCRASSNQLESLAVLPTSLVS